MTMKEIPSELLTVRLGELLGTERRTLVAFLRHLAEFEQRQLHLAAGYSSLFVYLTDHLRLAKSSAFRRSVCARLCAKFPRAAEMLESGELSLTTLAELREVLTLENHADVLARASGKNEEQVRELVASLAPRPAPVDRIRRVPAEPPAVLALPAPPAAEQSEFRAEPTVARPVRVEPIAPDRHVLTMTVDGAFRADLARAASLLSHRLPRGEHAAVLHECLRIAIEVLEKRRLGAGTGRSHPSDEAPARRYVPVAVRREVWDRDGGTCAFVGTEGHRCGSTKRVEFHHVRPFGKGGASTADNLQLRCAAHNQYEAVLQYGAAHMMSAVSNRPSAPATSAAKDRWA